MEKDTADRLLSLNRQFYQTFALQFSATRQRLQPGVRRILQTISLQDTVLDLGCGNGELARYLADRGQWGMYAGLDFSPALLVEARRGTETTSMLFIESDLTEAGWLSTLPPLFQPDVVLAFAVLHHIPGEARRIELLKAVHSILGSRKRLIHSVWQFLNSERLRQRIHPWEEVDIQPLQVDHGDYLLDWREGGLGLRYAHHFTQEELASLAVRTGFQIIDSFLSDGDGGRLGLYQVWESTGNFP